MRVPNFSNNIENTAKKQPRLPRSAVKILKDWLFSAEHIDNPYPTKEEKKNLLLATQGSVTMKQLDYWFINARRRSWEKKKKSIEHAHHHTQIQKNIPDGFSKENKHLQPSPGDRDRIRLTSRAAHSNKFRTHNCSEEKDSVQLLQQPVPTNRHCSLNQAHNTEEWCPVLDIPSLQEKTYHPMHESINVFSQFDPISLGCLSDAIFGDSVGDMNGDQHLFPIPPPKFSTTFPNNLSTAQAAREAQEHRSKPFTDGQFSCEKSKPFIPPCNISKQHPDGDFSFDITLISDEKMVFFDDFCEQLDLTDVSTNKKSDFSFPRKMQIDCHLQESNLQRDLSTDSKNLSQKISHEQLRSFSRSPGSQPVNLEGFLTLPDHSIQHRYFEDFLSNPAGTVCFKGMENFVLDNRAALPFTGYA